MKRETLTSRLKLVLLAALIFIGPAAFSEDPGHVGDARAAGESTAPAPPPLLK